jgi:hypothetical protein
MEMQKHTALALMRCALSCVNGLTMADPSCQNIRSLPPNCSKRNHMNWDP